MVVLSYEGTKEEFELEDLTRTMTFFKDMIEFYPDRSFDLPIVQELKTNPFNLIRSVVALSNNSQHPILDAMTCVYV